MNDDQARALDTLARLQAAAPPVAAARIADVTAVIERLADENAWLEERVRALQEELHSIPTIQPVAERVSWEARQLAADLGEALPEEDVTPADPEGLAAVLDVLRAAPSSAPAADSGDRLGTSVLPGSDSVEGAMPGAEAILPHYRAMLHPLVQSLHDETGFGTRARTRVDELLALIDALDRLNTIRRGLIIVHPIVFDPAELLRQTRRAMGARAAAKDQQLHVNTDAVLPGTLADGDLSQEILDTLVDNAIRYTDYGGEIYVTAESMGTDILFTVTDNGIGLEPADLDRIGTAFFRSPGQPVVQNQPGAGLRLFLARQLLDLQGGELFFSGEPGLGASFSFTLPAAEG